MAGTDALTGARYPGSADSPNVNQDIQNAVNDLSGIIGGIFTTTAARDTAFSTWVTRGNTMRDGLSCRVGGREQVYQGGSWHGAASIQYATTTVDTTLYTSTNVIMTLSVSDPLFPYKVACTASVLLGVVGAGTTVAGRLLVNGSVVNPVGPDVVNSGGSNIVNQLLAIPAQAVSGTLTGSSTVQLQVFKTGTAGNGFQGSTALYNSLTALVVPA